MPQLQYDILNTLDDGVFIIDREYTIVFVNAKMIELCGVGAAGVVNRKCYEVSHHCRIACPESAECQRENVCPHTAVFENGRPLTVTHHHLLPDGSTGFFEISASPLRDGAGRIIQLVQVLKDVTERHRAEEILRASEKRFRTVVDMATDAIFISDMDGRLIDVNLRACVSLGYSREELLQMTVADIDPRAVADNHHDNLWEKIFLGNDLTIDSLHQRRDGSTFPVEIHIGKVELDGCPAIVGIARDISVRKQAEAELQGQKDFLQTALDALTHPFTIIDARDYTVQLANRAAQTADYYEGVTCYRLTHHRDAPCRGDGHDCPLALLKKTKQPVILEHIHYNRYGRAQYFEVHAFPVLDAAGEVMRIIEYSLDISVRKAAEAERRLLVTAIEQGVGSVVITDSDATIQYVNSAFEQLTGYRRAEVIGQNPRILQSGKHDALFYRQMWDVLSSGRAWHGHFINKKKDGSLFEEEASITPVLGDAGEISSFVAVNQDVTERIQFERQRRQAHKLEAIGTLAGGIAHDFNNILTAIIGYATLALEAMPAGSAAASDLDEVLTAAERAAALVQQILAFSRRTEQNLAPVRIQFILKEALKLLRPSIPTTIDFKQNIDGACGAVLADPTQMHQIIMNLCTNAYHTMRECGGTLGVSLSQVGVGPDDMIKPVDLAPGWYALLEVSDTGCGMAPALLDKIFEPYFTTKKQGEGTGLGLAVVHGIVQSHGGHVSVDSEPGKGTSFHVYLPLLEKPETRVKKTVAAAPRIGGTERILVVDDEECIAHLEQKMLANLGYEVTALTSSEAAWQLFQDQPDRFRIVITDMTMPRMTGAELARNILAVRPEIPIILCTGFSETINAEQSRELGIRGYLMKPVVVHELARMIRHLLD